MYIIDILIISYVVLGLGIMVLSVTLNNISVISLRSDLLVEETGPSTRRKPPACRQIADKFIT